MVNTTLKKKERMGTKGYDSKAAEKLATRQILRSNPTLHILTMHVQPDTTNMTTREAKHNTQLSISYAKLLKAMKM